MTDESSTVTLRALEGAPLADRQTRDTVIATARAIAERTGVDILDLAAHDDHITVTLRCPKLAAIGLAAELRRLTNRWRQQKQGRSLWGEPEGHDPWRLGLPDSFDTD